MIPVEWFDRYAPGFAALTDGEREVISDFAMVWPLFEAKVLNSNARPVTIIRVSASWAAAGKLGGNPYADALSYFQARYVANGQLTDRFQHLNFRNEDREELVRRILLGQSNAPSELAAACLLIVYRYRNNLFHGLKMNYALAEQEENFRFATAVLMKAVDIHHE